jgi:hypothetical protein
MVCGVGHANPSVAVICRNLLETVCAHPPALAQHAFQLVIAVPDMYHSAIVLLLLFCSSCHHQPYCLCTGARRRWWCVATAPTRSGVSHSWQQHAPCSPHCHQTSLPASWAPLQHLACAQESPGCGHSSQHALHAACEPYSLTPGRA